MPKLYPDTSEIVTSRTNLAIRTIFIIILIFTGVLLKYQTIDYRKYLQIAVEKKLRIQVIAAPRGRIYDRNGVLLAKNRAIFSLKYFAPPNLEDAIPLFIQIEDKMHLTRGSLMINAIEQREVLYPYQPITLAEDLSIAQVAYFERRASDLPNTYVESGEYIREYPFGPITAHLLGYVGLSADSDLDKEKNPQLSFITRGEYIGKMGLERAFERELHGIPGCQTIELDRGLRFKKEIAREEPKSGADISLSVDIEMQKIANRCVSGFLGAIIVTDPRNGEILALASGPSYDPNKLRGKEASDYRSQLFADSINAPMLNRAFQSAFSPGSVFKPVVMMAGLEEKLITPNTSYYCGGKMTIKGQTWKCWDTTGHGAMNAYNAMAQSCDVYFYYLGRQLYVSADNVPPQEEGNPAYRLSYYAEQFGFNKPISNGLFIGERFGTLPSQKIKRKLFPKASAKHQRFYLGDIINYSIGQGFTTATPLQLVYMINSFAEDGKQYPPRVLVKSVTNKETKFYPVSKPKELAFSRESYKVIKQGLYLAANHPAGTAYMLRGLPFDVAGKTGTAQDPPRPTAHSWFVGYWPANNPRYSCVVFYQNAGSSHDVAVPLAFRLMLETMQLEAKRKRASLSTAAKLPPVIIGSKRNTE